MNKERRELIRTQVGEDLHVNEEVDNPKNKISTCYKIQSPTERLQSMNGNQARSQQCPLAYPQYKKMTLHLSESFSIWQSETQLHEQ